MLLRVPDFYDSFHCIADKCTDTCCVGWEIDIDETSAKRYKTVQGEFGEKLRQNIEDDHFKLLPGDRCPFLRQDGLCDMICNLGEGSLCDICREHPRFATSPIAFIEREIDDAPDEIPDDALEARDVIFEERNHLFKILADHSKPLNVRLIELLDYAIETSGLELSEPGDSEVRTNYKISNNIHHSWIDVLGKGESYGPAWDSAYKKIKEIGWSAPANSEAAPNSGSSIFTDSDGEKIIAYLLFRYYEKSLFDGNSLTKVEFAIYFWIMLQKFGKILAGNSAPQTAPIDAIKLLSKQTEYSEEIMEILEQEFMENPAFLPAIFKRILAE